MDAFLVGVLVACLSALAGLFAWIANRLVRQLDRVSLTLDVTCARLDRHETWHMLNGDRVVVPSESVPEDPHGH